MVILNDAALVEFALKLIGQESLSGQEGLMAHVVATEMHRLGLYPIVDAWGNVVGVLTSGPGPVLLLDAHMDTVGIEHPEQWHSNPHGEIRDGRLYGRGAVDMKGALGAMIHGIASLKNDPLPGTVVVCASVCEEWMEGPALMYACQQFAPDYVLIGEATNLTLAVGQKGRAEISIDVLGTPAHSSRPLLGVNAAEHMVDVVQALRNVAVPTHTLLGDGILVLTDLLSRPSPALSTIPAYCHATYDRRLLPGEDIGRVLDPIKAVVSTVLAGTGTQSSVTIARENFSIYSGVAVTVDKFAPAWAVDRHSPLVHQALTALDSVFLAPTISYYAFCTNGSGSAGVLGIPTLGFGPGDPDRAHQIDESVAVDDLASAARGYAAIARELMSMR